MRNWLESAEVLKQAIKGCQQCSHVPEEDLERVSEGMALVSWNDDGGYGPEHSCTVVVRVKDGWAVINEGEDSTGHGCQCSGDVAFYKTLEKAVRLGLTTDQRNEWRASPFAVLEASL